MICLKFNVLWVGIEVVYGKFNNGRMERLKDRGVEGFRD
jgi:hypothetical protein